MRVLHLDTGREMRGGQWQCLQLVEAAGQGSDAAGGGTARPACGRARHRRAPVQPRPLGAAGTRIRPGSCPRRTVAQLGGVARRGAADRLPPCCLPDQGRRFVALEVRATGRASSPCPGLSARLWWRQGCLQEKIDVVYDGVQVPAGVAAPERIVALASDDPMKGTSAHPGGCPHRQASRSAYSADLERDLPHASVFVYITRSEGLGSAALLAMAWGVPVVASREGGFTRDRRGRRAPEC